MPSTPRSPLVRSLLAAALAAAGCNSTLTDREGVPDATAVIFQTAADSEVGGEAVAIRYNLQNATARPTDILAEFSKDGGAFATATSNGGEGVENLSTSQTAAGSPHTFTWNSVQDLGEVDADATLRITPEIGLPATLGLRALNAPRPTTVTVTTPSAAQAGSEVTLTYFLKNERSQTVGVIAEYRTPPGTGAYAPATRNGGEGTTGLATNNTTNGRQHSFVWDSVADLPDQDRTVEFRIRPASGVGTEGTATFQVLNTPKDVTVNVVRPPVLNSAGVVPVGYRLTSAVASVTDMTVEYSVNGGAFAPATSAGCDDSLADLASSTGGTDYEFRWDSLLDLPGGGTNVVLRLTPSQGAAASTSAFNVVNSDFTEAPEDLVNGTYAFPAPQSGSINLSCVLGSNPVGSFEIQPDGGVDVMTFDLDDSSCLPLPTGSRTVSLSFPFAGVSDVPSNANVAATTVTLSSPAAVTAPFTIGELTGDPDFSFTVSGLTVNVGACRPDFAFTTNGLSVDTDRTGDPDVNTLTGTITFTITIKDNPADTCRYPPGFSATTCTSTPVAIVGTPG